MINAVAFVDRALEDIGISFGQSTKDILARVGIGISMSNPCNWACSKSLRKFRFVWGGFFFNVPMR